MTQENLNPYQAPIPTEQVLSQPSKRSPFFELAKRSFLAWEKLRIVYNAVCAVATLGAAMVFGLSLNRIEYWGWFIFGGCVANIFYFAGPVVESYVTWLGFNPNLYRVSAFTVGTLFTCACAVAAVFELTYI